jgi:hypothetical protein
MASKNMYVTINSETRRTTGYGSYATKHAAQCQVRRDKQHGRSSFVVTIPKSEFSAWHAAYLRQHGTWRNPA